MADQPAGYHNADRWTLGAIRERGLRLEAVCRTPGCGWFGTFDVDQLIAGLGPDYELPEHGPGLTCQKCGGDEVRFQLAMVPPGQP